MQKVLVIEDEKTIAQALAIRLKARGYQAIMSHDAIMGISAAVKENPDLVILDISMPCGNGFQVAKRLGALSGTCTTPIIFITASKAPNTREKALAHINAVGFFEKPYDVENLMSKVDTTLQASS